MSADRAAFDDLVSRVEGPVLQPRDHDFDAERQGFQTAFHHQPDVIVGARVPGDICAAVAYAAANDLPVAVQATGHGITAVADGGVLVTTRRMDDVAIDAASGTARIAAGARWTRVMAEAARHGLAPLSGSSPEVGAVGYTLGGGIGLLGRRYGYAADHVRSIDVVTADARMRHVTSTDEADLFWALRGGRDNVGIVAALEIGLVPVQRIYGGGMFFAGEYASAVLDAFRSWTAAAPDRLAASVGMLAMPDLPGVPEPIRGRHIAHLRFAYDGDADSGGRLAAPLRDIGPRLIDDVREMAYAESGAVYRDPPMPHAYYGNNVALSELPKQAVESVLRLAGPDAPVPCVVDIRHLGGALSREPAVPSAVPYRDAAYIVRVLSPLARADLAAVRETHARVFEALSPWTLGRCLSFVYGRSEPNEHVDAVYPPEIRRRLAQVKATYDPRNLFRVNQNVPPA